VRTIAITGAATGIGAAMKRHLESEGHRVIGVDIRQSDIIADLSNAQGRQSAIENLKSVADLDTLITCAGLGSHVPDKAAIASVNYFGSTELVTALAPILAARDGKVVMISSNSAPQSSDPTFVDLLLSGDEEAARQRATEIEGHPVYSGSKLAVARWMRRQCPEFARSGLRINAIAPGYIETPMTAAVANDPTYGAAIKKFVESIPVGRPGRPEDIASVVAFLLSPAADFICGSVLFVDGAHDAMMRPDVV